MRRSGTALGSAKRMRKSGISGPGSANPIPAKEGRSMGVRSTSGVDSTDDTDDDDAVRRVGVRGPAAKTPSCPKKRGYPKKKKARTRRANTFVNEVF